MSLPRTSWKFSKSHMTLLGGKTCWNHILVGKWRGLRLDVIFFGNEGNSVKLKKKYDISNPGFGLQMLLLTGLSTSSSFQIQTWHFPLLEVIHRVYLISHNDETFSYRYVYQNLGAHTKPFGRTCGPFWTHYSTSYFQRLYGCQFLRQ